MSGLLSKNFREFLLALDFSKLADRLAHAGALVPGHIRNFIDGLRKSDEEPTFQEFNAEVFREMIW